MEEPDIVIRPNPAQRWTLVAVLGIGFAAVCGQTAWLISEPATNDRDDALLFAAFAVLIFQYSLIRAIGVRIIVNSRGLITIGMYRKRRFDWEDLTDLVIEPTFNGKPGLYVVLKPSRKRRLLPLTVQRQRTPDLEALRHRILDVRPSANVSPDNSIQTH